MEDEPASFWAFEIPPGGRLSQHVPPGACVCLTRAVLATPSEKRCILTACTGGYSAVLCNLFGTGAHDSAHLGQPFSNDFELTVDGLGTSAVHVSGFSKGDLGPVETETAEKRPAQTGKPVEIAAVGPVTSGSKGTGAASSSIAGRAKAVDSAAMMGIEDEGEEDDGLLDMLGD
mmetsp:Transcript_24916/g.50045  ORF Transcript_24916/g.50045 Transcript_24916/m.50045 type:complete len:174 (-) Transcript_24916:98-619(-)